MAQPDDTNSPSAGPSESQRQQDPITIRGFDPPRNQDGVAASWATAIPSSASDVHPPRRRSSVAERLSSLADVGGVNSLNNFARSWQRAAGFFEVTPVRRSFAVNTSSSDDESEDVQEVEGSPQPKPHLSMLRAALRHEGRGIPEEGVANDAESAISDANLVSYQNEGVRRRLEERRSTVFDESIYSIEPALSSPFSRSHSTSYGSFPAGINQTPSMRHAGRLFHQQQTTGSNLPDQEREPLLVKQVEGDEGKLVNVVIGQSTLPQTVFNSVNVLMGIGILSLPLAIRYSGWLIGLSFFSLSAVVTGYTANLLAKCLDVESTLITFGDLAYISFGSKARVAVSILFTLELIASCVALVIIFADSLDALIPGWGRTEFKALCGIVTVPLAFAPLRLLSFTSIVGIMSCLAIVIAIFLDGLVKDHALGSLREPAETYLFPANWNTLPLAFGLLMAPWGGHSVFPNIYRDMRHPYKYPKAVNVTYIFTYVCEAALAIAGYLMFGEATRDEITANIFKTQGYPRWISIFMLVAIAVIPLTKLPLNARPIVATVEIYCGLDARVMSSSTLVGTSAIGRGFLKVAIRILTIVLFVIVAILVPSFDRVMSLLGSAACFTICVVLPCAFHIRIFGKDLPLWQRTLDWTLIITCSILGLVGTVYSFIPKAVLGIK